MRPSPTSVTALPAALLLLLLSGTAVAEPFEDHRQLDCRLAPRNCTTYWLTRGIAPGPVMRFQFTGRQPALTWAQRLKRVFAIDIEKSAGLPMRTADGRRETAGLRDVPDETCLQCGDRLRVIASIEVPAVIERILEHLGRDAESVEPPHPSRATQDGSVDLTAAAAPSAPVPRAWTGAR